MTRSTKDVVQDHLALAREGLAGLEEDLRRNYAEDVVILAGPRGVHRGRAGARALAEVLVREMPDARFVYLTEQYEGEVALLEWAGSGGGARVRDGADTFVVRDGRIRAQTIHYTVERG